jgi:hypothetical protein
MAYRHLNKKIIFHSGRLSIHEMVQILTTNFGDERRKSRIQKISTQILKIRIKFFMGKNVFNVNSEKFLPTNTF